MFLGYSKSYSDIEKVMNRLLGRCDSDYWHNIMFDTKEDALNFIDKYTAICVEKILCKK